MSETPTTAVILGAPSAPVPAPRQAGGFSLEPRNLDEAMRLSEMLADSELVPKDYRGKPGNVLVAVQWGHEVGLKPLQALQNIAVINGRPSLWGDALIALARNSPLCEYVIETEEAGTAFCRVKRRGEPEQVRTFSKADAEKAGLWGKAGPWTSNPRRMMQMRARAFALRDVFPDVLKGLAVAEEVIDIPTPELAPLPSQGGQAVTVPQDLIDAGAAAAEQGWKEFGVWWQGTPEERRRLVGDRFEAWKARAAEVTRLAKAAAEKPAATTAEQADVDAFVDDMNAAEAAEAQPQQDGDAPAP